jgi:hypothetical protein
MGIHGYNYVLTCKTDIEKLTPRSLLFCLFKNSLKSLFKPLLMFISVNIRCSLRNLKWAKILHIWKVYRIFELSSIFFYNFIFSYSKPVVMSYIILWLFSLTASLWLWVYKKLDENYKSSIFLIPPFDPFFVKNSNS